ncbi:prepilin peptidase, partial [Alcaligenes pakistanensis]
MDAETGYLPDRLTLPLLWLGLLVNLDHTFSSLPLAVLGAALGYG